MQDQGTSPSSASQDDTMVERDMPDLLNLIKELDLGKAEVYRRVRGQRGQTTTVINNNRKDTIQFIYNFNAEHMAEATIAHLITKCLSKHASNTIQVLETKNTESKKQITLIVKKDA